MQAYTCYGVYTIIDMATAYGSALGLDSTGLLHSITTLCFHFLKAHKDVKSVLFQNESLLEQNK